MDMMPYLQLMSEQGASDLFFSTGTEPRIKIRGRIKSIGESKLVPGQVAKMADVLMTEQQAQEFEQNMEMNFAVPISGLGRFRVNIFRQRGEVSLVIRFISGTIPTFQQLKLPEVLGEIIMEHSGLILVTGTTGSGKSSTLAAMINHRNHEDNAHILTIEDPLEYIHTHDKSIVQQREVGIDTHSYESALENALREAPDVIMIGEIRDQFTMKQALMYAETGHLCLATLHSINADQTLERVLNFFPQSSHKQILMDLSLTLRAIISQRLVVGTHGQLLPAIELMMNSSYIKDLIAEGRFDAIKDVMAQGTEEHNQTFDKALLELYQSNQITVEEAIANADSKNDLSLAIRTG